MDTNGLPDRRKVAPALSVSLHTGTSPEKLLARSKMNRKKALEELLDILGEADDDEEEPAEVIEDPDDFLTNFYIPKHLKELGRPDLSRLRKAVWPWR